MKDMSVYHQSDFRRKVEKAVFADRRLGHGCFLLWIKKGTERQQKVTVGNFKPIVNNDSKGKPVTSKVMVDPC
jgi:hypothetical protein